MYCTALYCRPWDSEEDLCQQVVLTSSGCASGCASDHLPHAKSGNLLGRSVPSLHSTLVRPGYTQLNTLPAVRSVSGERDRGQIFAEICGRGFYEVEIILRRIKHLTSHVFLRSDTEH